MLSVDLRTVADIQRKIIKQDKRNAVTQLFHAKNDKEKIATWRADLNRILLVFNVRSIAPCAAIIKYSSPDRARNRHTRNRHEDPRPRF